MNISVHKHFWTENSSLQTFFLRVACLEAQVHGARVTGVRGEEQKQIDLCDLKSSIWTSIGQGKSVEAEKVKRMRNQLESQAAFQFEVKADMPRCCIAFKTLKRIFPWAERVFDCFNGKTRC